MYSWKVEQANEQQVTLEVVQARRGIDFVRELCGSKATAGKVIEAGTLRYADEKNPVLANDELVAGARVTLVFDRGDAELSTAGSSLVSGQVTPGHASFGRAAASPMASGPSAPNRAVVLYEDPFMLCANKPAGLLVHSNGENDEGPTLTDLVQEHLRQKGSPAVDSVQAIQRLDVETTGLVLFSKTHELQPQFDALVSGRGMQKFYLAVVLGRMEREELRIDAPLGRDRHDARLMRVNRSGKRSVTVVRNLAYQDGFSLVRCQLLTGRRHQIRVHLAYAGHPIVGDVLYRGPSSRKGLMLHAACERFVHPITGEQLTFEAPWPERFSTYFAPQPLDLE